MQYVRLRPGELAELRRLVVADPNRAFDYVDELGDDEPEKPTPAQTRAYDTDKAWEAIRALLERAGPPPVDVITGGTPLTEDEWGYEPPRLLTADEVAVAAAHLRATPWDALAREYDAEAFTDAEIYPQIWDEEDALEYLRPWYTDLVTYVGAAADEGHALVVWLS